MRADKKRKRSYWIIGVVILLAAAAAVFFVLNQQGKDEATATAETGGTVTAFIGDLSASATASGQVLPRREASLALASPGQVEQVHVRVGEEVRAGDALLQLDTDDLALNVAVAEQNLLLEQTNLAELLEPASPAKIAAAEAAVASAQANLNDLLAGPTTAELAASEANLRASEASLWSALAELAGVQSSIGDNQIQAAQAALMSAQLNLRHVQDANEANPNEATHNALMEANQAVAAAQSQLDTLLAGPDQGQLGTAQSGVTSASAQVDGNQANLNILGGGATVAQIAAGESQLAQGRATLANLLDGPSDEHIQAAQARVEQARLSLADAQETLAKRALVAPFDGVVTAIYASEGEFASGTVVELVDIDSLEVVLEVDEVDIGTLSVGQPAVITLETWPEIEIESEILTIAPRAQSSVGSALVTYQVHLALGRTELPIRVGMTANANLITAQKEEVLLVPNEAINVDRQAGIYSVNLVLGETSQIVEVTVGLHDDRHTQITGGLNPGDELLVSNSIPSLLDGSGEGGGFFIEH